MKKILPPSVIGIIGGGQLGRMLAIEAKQMGYKVAILDPNKDACAKVVSDYFIQAEFSDFEKMESLCEISDVITFEFENIDCSTLEKLSKKNYFTQSSEILKIAQNRELEKRFAQKLSIPCVPFYIVKDNLDIELDGKYLMKTLRFGYDGKGQKIITSKSKIEPNTILEKYVQLQKEVSVVACKSVNGIHIIGVIENEHRNNILYRSYIPAQIEDNLKNQAIAYTNRILNEFDYYGVLTVEYFIVDNQVIFNEMAPRVHNSGHITLQSNNISQFNAYIKSICGLPIGEINSVSTTMYNILGQDLDKYLRIMQSEDCFVHLYEKAPKHNRKIGHINFYGRKEHE